MRLIDVDKIQPKYQDMDDLGQEGFYFYDVEDINNAEPVNLANMLDNFKRELLEILDSYSTLRFIDTSEMDVDKFKEEMSKTQLYIKPNDTIPISKIDKIIGYVQSLEHMGLGKHKSLVYIEKFIREECKS